MPRSLKFLVSCFQSRLFLLFCLIAKGEEVVDMMVCSQSQAELGLCRVPLFKIPLPFVSP